MVSLLFIVSGLRRSQTVSLSRPSSCVCHASRLRFCSKELPKHFLSLRKPKIKGFGFMVAFIHSVQKEQSTAVASVILAVSNARIKMDMEVPGCRHQQETGEVST